MKQEGLLGSKLRESIATTRRKYFMMTKCCSYQNAFTYDRMLQDLISISKLEQALTSESVGGTNITS